MSKRKVKLPAQLVARRIFNANVMEHSYKNPFLLGYLYYTAGYSTIEMAGMLDCEQRTIRRYMNYYGMQRFDKSFAQLVKHYGVEEARNMQAPEYYPLGIHND